MDRFLPYLETALSSTWTVLNSGLARSLIVAFAGALCGALVAKRIAERAKLKDELLKEIRNLNAASLIAHSIANAHLAVKKQHIKALYDTFNAKRAEFNDVRARRQMGDQRLQFEIAFDFQTLTPLIQPIESLQSLVFEKITASAKAIMLTGTLSQVLQSLNESLTNRNALIAAWRERKLTQADLLILYLGLPDNTGHVVDQTYPSLIEAIYRYTDDVICFSKMLGDELASQGDQAKNLYDKRFPRGESPMITKVQFPADPNLMPPAEQFADFDKMFRTVQRPKKRSFLGRPGKKSVL